MGRLGTLLTAIIALSMVTPTSPLTAQTAAQGASQTAQTRPQPLAEGTVAPDFTLTTVNSDGRTAAPFRLSEHRGKTVVLAFFPKARTAGCTVQMESYRNQYAALFNGGKDVILIGISIDPDTALVSWAKDAHIPFLFGSDESRTVGGLYGASNGTSGAHRRDVYVINPRGVISYVASPFAQMAEVAYTDLGKAVKVAAEQR